MADEPQWQPAEAPPWLKQEKPAEPKWQPADEPPWVKNAEGPSLGRVAQRAGEAVSETAGGAWEAAKRLVVPPSKEEAQKHLGPSGVLRSFKETGESLLSPFTGTVGTAIAGAASPIASGVSELARRITGGDPKRSEEMYEYAKPMAEAALGAVGAKPGVTATPKGSSLPDFRIAPTKVVRGEGPEADAGRYLESQAKNPAEYRRKLQQPEEEIAGKGDKPTTFEHTGDLGIGQETRAAARRPGQVEEYQARQAEQNRARLEALEQAQSSGNPQAVSEHLRNIAREQETAANENIRLAEQRAWDTTRQLGGENDATTYGNVLRQELRNAEEATRAEERTLWQQVDPGGTLRANPQPLQELERSIYGVMPEGGAAEASLTAAEQTISGIIQKYRNIIPYQELRDLRSLVNTQLREELISSGTSSPAYARLSRLRQGIADMEGRAFDEMGVLDPEASQRLRAASTATRERAEEFGRGPVGEVLRREGSQGPFRVGESSVPERFVRSGAKGYDSAASFLRASPESLDVLQDAVAASARREVVNPDGSINPRRLEGWLKRYQDTLRAIDERDGGAFSQRLRDLGTAQDTLEAAQARQTTLARERANDQFRELTGAVDDTSATNMIANILGKRDSVGQARALMSRLTGNDAAIEGARAAVIRHIGERFLSNASVGDDPVIRSQVFQKWVSQNKPALQQILDPAQVQKLEDIARSLQRAARINQTKAVGGGSDSLQAFLKQGNQQGALRAAVGKYGSFVGKVLVHWIGAQFGIPGVAASVATEGVIAGTKAATAARKAQRLQTIQDLVDEALLNPAKARELQSKTQAYKAGRLPGAREVTTYEAGALGAATRGEDEDKKRRPRQAGGGVPAIGGTGGRPPGARETARAGAARSGPSQALQDGGEAREQQSAAPVGGRERFAAALQGVPTGAGFGGGGGQQRKPKALTTPSREDIRRTLQSFGITGETAGGFAERQLGEVDSRATGGGVDDPSGERSPMHYDPGDDTTFDARFGKWDQTATGKSLPRDDEDVDTTILAPGQKLIDQYGHRGVRDPTTGYYQTRGMAEGGAVDRLPDRDSNIEDRRSEEPLTAGQMIAGNQAFMGHYPAPYTRAPRRAATAQARADGGEVEDKLHQGLMPSTLLDETKQYIADQISGVEQEHEQQDPLEAAVKHSGAQKNPPGYGGSDEGDVNSFEAAAARTRRRAPVREPDPASLAASQGRVSWADLAHHKLEQGAHTVTAPGRAYKQGMTPDEEIESAQGLSGLMGGARFPGVAAGKVEGSLGTFGGRNAKTADLDALAWATKKRAEGASRGSIWNQTGWWRMPDAEWAFEIPDRGSYVKPTPREGTGFSGASIPSLVHKGELGDVLHHPELYKAYPELAKIPTEVRLGSGPGGGYFPPDWMADLRNPGAPKDLGKIHVEAPQSAEHPGAVHRQELTNDITPWRVLLHETTHGIQHTQEPTWAQGGNPYNLPYTDRQITNLAKKEALEAGVPLWALRPGQVKELEDIIRKQEYQQLWGEMLPRMVERRRHYELGQRPPWEDLDLPWDKKIRIQANEAIKQGFKPLKGKSPWKKPEKFAEGGEVDEPAEAEAARETAAARTGHRGRQEGATTSFLDSALPVWMRAAAQKPLAYPEAAKAMGNMLATIPERIGKFSGQLATTDPDDADSRDRLDASGPGDLVMLGLGARMPVKASPGEVVLGAGRTRPPTPPRSHNLPPGEEPLPLERRTSSLSLRDMPLDKAIEQAKTEQHLIPSRVKEGYVGAPNWVKTPEDLARLRANFDAQVERGLLGAKWYEEAQGGIKEMAPDDPRRQHQVSQELALTSAQSTPDTNLGFMLQGHNAIAAGKPLSVVRTGQQAETMREGHAAGEMHLGRKTGIYARHMDPTMENPATGTNDIWHARALGYPEDNSSLGAAQHAFMDAETVLAVARANEKKLGGRTDWTPGEIQAAPWVAGKAKGLQEQFGWTPERSMAEAVKTYPQFFNKYTAYGTHEATPGIGVGHLPQIAKGTEAERAAYSANPASTWQDPSTGEDIMYRGAGMYVRPTRKATGIFEGPEGLEINPAEVARPMVSYKGKAGSRELGTADRALMTGVEAARAYIDAQNAGAWSALIRGQKTGDTRSVNIPRSGPPGPMPLGDVKQLLAIGGRHGLPGVIDYGEGTALTSFGGEGAATGKQVAAGLRPKGALGEELRTALPGTEPGAVKLDTGYIDYSGKWSKGEGSGAVTRELKKHLMSKEAPGLIANLDADPSIRMAVADRIHRDIQLAEKAGHPIREDLMRARQIIVEDGFAGLFEALKRGVALPAAAVVPALELLRQLQGQEQPSGG